MSRLRPSRPICRPIGQDGLGVGESRTSLARVFHEVFTPGGFFSSDASSSALAILDVSADTTAEARLCVLASDKKTSPPGRIQCVVFQSTSIMIQAVTIQDVATCPQKLHEISGLARTAMARDRLFCANLGVAKNRGQARFACGSLDGKSRTGAWSAGVIFFAWGRRRV